MNSAQIRRLLRRRHFKVITPWLYIISGVTMLAIGESPTLQGWIHIVIGIVESLG